MPTCRSGYGYRKLQLRTPNAQLGVPVTHPPHVYIEAQKPHFKIRVLILDLPDPDRTVRHIVIVVADVLQFCNPRK